MNKVRYLQVSLADAGQRIDNFLRTRLKGIPKSLIYKILRTGEVRVNKGRIKPSYKILANDQIRLPPIKSNDNNNYNANSTSTTDLAIFKCLMTNIVYEDDNLLILNKPSGLAVHGGSGVANGLIEILRKYSDSKGQLELIHRIDRDTSGCIMLAKNKKILRAMHSLLREGKIIKTYYALVKGYVSGNFNVNAPLLRYHLQSGERMVKVHAEGQPSKTSFLVLKHYPGATLLKVVPKTGRTHQIRVHAKYQGFPLAGDLKYGHKEFNQRMKQQGLKRLFLHAMQLKFKCPVTHRIIDVSAPLGAKIENFLANLTTKDTSDGSNR